MYELIQVGENTFYMDCPAKVGFYRISADEVVAIDSGNDKDAGKKVKKILDAQGWKLAAIYNTHSHADHIGGNQYLQTQTGCRIYAAGIEQSFTEHPILEPTLLYGANSLKDLHNKFLMAKESVCEKLSPEVLPKGLEIIELPGHCYDMVGFRTGDDVVFLADCLSSSVTLEKYQVGFIYDIEKYLETLEMVKTMTAAVFVPSHADVTKDISSLAQINIDKTKEIAGRIAEIASEPKTFEDILAELFTAYNLTMNLQQMALVGSTVKSYLKYLNDRDIVSYTFENNKMYWSKN